MTHVHQMTNILIMKRTHWNETFKGVYLPVDFLFHGIEFKSSKNSAKEEIECEVVEFDHVYETNDNIDFKIETVDNFPLPFNEFYDVSQDSFQDRVNKFVVSISLTDEEAKHIEYSARGQQTWKTHSF